MASSSSSNFELGAILGSVATIVLYYIVLFYRIRIAKDYSIQMNKNMRSMKAWAKRHLEKQDAASVQLGVQALRNTIFVAIFVGGFAINLAYSFLDTLHTSNFTGFSDVLWMKDVRSLILIVLLFCSFLNWAAVLRYACELAFIIDSNVEASNSCPMEETEKVVWLSRTTELSVLMTLHFTFGLRFMYISIPFAFMSAGPIALIIATVLIILFHVDHDFNRYKIDKQS